jgi:hypothetical protein
MGRQAIGLGGVIERRFAGDRLSASASLMDWLPLSGGTGFQRASLHGSLRSSPTTRGFVQLVDVNAETIGATSPLALWPGAGDGRARDVLLRAHPLLHDGAVAESALARQILALNLESQRWFSAPAASRAGLVAFADIVKASRRLDPSVSGAAAIDVGVGLRLHLPGQDGTWRVDVARGLRDGRRAVSVGWSADAWRR